ncbi:tetratricopeptide repeat protein [Nitrospirillum sp. BR 11164]|uniref:tetratricopeptide repeat protein n=1 Tax=Nitrospirillum sp. BR 11164 TaxID=3104324 RepID=UPI002AFDEF34|nr:tetratricopeptide repeat protein [Nitrospirillum sp. BR 11164]MEA1653193.1 tetratricopeptide repeat protein [Nitrospirillum sp. BR 11164]
MATIAEALQAALDHHQAGRLAEARILYGRVLAVAPDTPDALYLLGVLDAQAGHFDAAATGLERALALRPEAVAYRLTLAKALMASGRAEAAIPQFRAILAQQPDQAEALATLARLLAGQGEPSGPGAPIGKDEAAALFERAARLAPADAALALDQGRCLHSLGRLDAAAAALTRALFLATGTTAAGAHITLGRVREAQGREDAALAAYQAGLAVPGLAAADPLMAAQGLQAQGALLHKQDQAQDAATAYEAALALAPDLLPARFGLGQVLAGLGRLEAAGDCFRAVLDRDPANLMAHEALWQLHERQERPDQALAALDGALALAPDRPDLLFARARLLHQARRDGEAVSAYAALMAMGDLAPDLRAAAASNRATLLVARGEVAAAAALLSDIQVLVPGTGAAGMEDCHRLARLLADIAPVADQAWDALGHLVAWVATEWRARDYFWKSAYYLALETGNHLLAEPDGAARLPRLVAAVTAAAMGRDPLLDPWFTFLDGCVALRLGQERRARDCFAGLERALPFAAQVPLGDDFQRWTAAGAPLRAGFDATLDWGRAAAGGADEPVVLVAADSGYVRRFLPFLAASIAAVAAGARLHVHICDPAAGDVDFLAAAAPGLRLGWSTEALDPHLHHETRLTYLTAARFLRLPHIQDRYGGAPLVVADIDAAFLTDPVRFVAALPAGRPVAATWGPANLAAPYDAVGGGLVVVGPGDVARAFTRGVADLLLYHWHHSREGGPVLGYFLDQVALVAGVRFVLTPDRLLPINRAGRVYRLDGGRGPAMFVPIVPEKALPDIDARLDQAVAALRAGAGRRALEAFFQIPPLADA